MVQQFPHNIKLIIVEIFVPDNCAGSPALLLAHSIMLSLTVGNALARLFQKPALFIKFSNITIDHLPF